MLKLSIKILILAVLITGCAGPDNEHPQNDNPRRAEPVSQEADSGHADGGNENRSDITRSKTKAPRSSADFFLLLPVEYVKVGRCIDVGDIKCVAARREFLRRYIKFENPEKTYLETRKSGTNESLKMALFTPSSGSRLIAISVSEKNHSTSSLLEYSNGRWADVSLEKIPEYSTTNIYEPSRDGKSVAVHAKKITAQKENFEVSKKGEKLYILEWKDGGFLIKR